MINRELVIVVIIAAIMISIPVTYFPIFRAQGAPAKLPQSCHEIGHRSAVVHPAGANMTSASNMTGAAGNTTGGSMHTAKPAGYLKHIIIIPAGVNMTGGSNMTGANTTAAHGSSIPTTHPAGAPETNNPHLKLPEAYCKTLHC